MAKNWVISVCLLLGWLTGTGHSFTEVVDGAVVDMCKTPTLFVKSEGMHGQIIMNSSTIDHNVQQEPCVLKIASCSSCKLRIIPATVSNGVSFRCPMNQKHVNICPLGCDYLAMFDEFYMNETLSFYSSLNNSQYSRFESISSNMMLLFCHSQAMYSFVLNFTTVGKVQHIAGSSADEAASTGIITSPQFPSGYAQNHEMYKYIFASPRTSDEIQLEFDDWHLASTSALQFEDSNLVGPVYGQSKRWVIYTTRNSLTVKFHTGQAKSPGGEREFMGFKATYKFFNNQHLIPRPDTGCGTYLMDSPGGTFSFQPSGKTEKYYDCIWVVKAQPGYQGVTLKVISFTTNRAAYNIGINQVRIYKGLTSLGPLVTAIEADTRTFTSYSHDVGFYIRLNASLMSSDRFMVAYASYKDPESMCYKDRNMFQCKNRKCIDKNLRCDNYSHCADNSDETTGCADNPDEWAKSYQYTITIGVIIPMVVSVFLIMLICLLFIMIRRCRQARLRELERDDRLHTLNENSGRRRGRSRGRRRRLRNLFESGGQPDAPPTYDEAIQSPPPWYLNVAFGNSPADPSLPKPPSYSEAVLGQDGIQLDSPDSDSSHSELSDNIGHQSFSSSSTWADTAVHTSSRHISSRRRSPRRMSYSSDSDTDTDTCPSHGLPTSDTNDTGPFSTSADLSSPSYSHSPPEEGQNRRNVRKNKKKSKRNQPRSEPGQPNVQLHSSIPIQPLSDIRVHSQPHSRRADDSHRENTRKKTPNTRRHVATVRRELDMEESHPQYSDVRQNTARSVEPDQSCIQIEVPASVDDQTRHTSAARRTKTATKKKGKSNHRGNRTRQGQSPPAHHATQTDEHEQDLSTIHTDTHTGGSVVPHQQTRMNQFNADLCDPQYNQCVIPCVNQVQQEHLAEHQEIKPDTEPKQGNTTRHDRKAPPKPRRKKKTKSTKPNRRSEDSHDRSSIPPYLASALEQAEVSHVVNEEFIQSSHPDTHRAVELGHGMPDVVQGMPTTNSNGYPVENGNGNGMAIAHGNRYEIPYAGANGYEMTIAEENEQRMLFARNKVYLMPQAGVLDEVLSPYMTNDTGVYRLDTHSVGYYPGPAVGTDNGCSIHQPDNYDTRLGHGPNTVVSSRSDDVMLVYDAPNSNSKPTSQLSPRRQKQDQSRNVETNLPEDQVSVTLDNAMTSSQDPLDVDQSGHYTPGFMTLYREGGENDDVYV